MKEYESRKKDGFKDEQYVIIPTESFGDYREHPLIKGMYMTDVGFFPNALHHYREREEGITENILIYCMEGEGTIILNERTYQLKAKEAFCIPAGEKHRYFASNKHPWSIFWVHFKGDMVEHYPLKQKQTIEIRSREAENRIITLFDNLFRVTRRNYTLGNFIYMSQLISLILAEIYFREKTDEASKQNKQVTMMIRYMYKNIHRTLSLDDLVEELGLSKSYISGIFKKYTEKAPIEFFIALKMQEACRQLKATDKYIMEIGQALGYDDPYYFSRIFKKTVGVSPREYRNGSYFH